MRKSIIGVSPQVNLHLQPANHLCTAGRSVSRKQFRLVKTSGIG